MPSDRTRAGTITGAAILPAVLLALALHGAPIQTASADTLSLTGAVDSEILETQRARQDIGTWQLSHANTIAHMDNTSVEGGYSGDNLLGAGALSDINGIATVIQNSGHNVIIQESMILNINVTP